MNSLPGIQRLSTGGPLSPSPLGGVAGAVMSGLPSLTSPANPAYCQETSYQTPVHCMGACPQNPAPCMDAAAKGGCQHVRFSSPNPALCLDTANLNPALCLDAAKGACPQSPALCLDAVAKGACPPQIPRVRFSSAADLLQPPSKPQSGRRSSALSPAIHVTTPVDGVLTSL